MATLTERLQFIMEVNNRSVVKGLQEVGSTAEKELSKADKRLDELGNKMTKVGAGAVAFAGVAGAALWKVGTAAGDKTQAISAMEQVLGDASKQVLEWSKNSVRAVGLSKTAYVEAATQFGGIGKAAEMSSGEVAGFSKEMIQLASDMAAFKNTSVDESLAALQSGFAGQAMPLREYNIYLDQATLKQAYFNETGERVTGTLTAQQRIIATHAEIMRQSTDIQGQWNREIDSNESKTIMFKASLNDLAAGIGQGVVPVMSTMLDGLNGIVGAFNRLSPTAQTAIGGIAGVGVAAVGTLGSVSLLVGQAIKMRDNLAPLGRRLKDAEGNMTGLGRAAKATGLALGTLALVNVGGDIYNEVSGASDRTSSRLQQLQIEIGKLKDGVGDADTVLRKFRDLVAAEDGKFKLKNFTDLSSEFVIIGGAAQRSISDMKDAFRSILNDSPEQARLLLDTWGTAIAELTATLDDLDPNSEEFDRVLRQVIMNGDALNTLDNIYRNAVGSAEALASATDGTTAAQRDASQAVDDYNASLTRLRKPLEDMAKAAKERVDSLRDELDALEDVRDAQQDLLDARLGVVDSSAGFDRANNRMLQTLRDMPKAVKDAKGDQLALNDVYWDAADAVAAAAAADEEKFRIAYEAEGLTLSEADAIDVRNRALVRGLASWQGDRSALIERIALLNNIPATTAAEIVTIFDEQGAEAADEKLAEVSATREVAVNVDEANSDVDDKIAEVEEAEYNAEIIVAADTNLAKLAIKEVEDGDYTATVKVKPQVYGVPGGLIGPAAPAAKGMLVPGTPTLALIGETGDDEVVLNLDDPASMRPLLAKPRVLSRILGALGKGSVVPMAQGGLVTRGSMSGGRSVELRGVSFGDALDTVFAGYAQLLGATDGLTEAQHSLNDALRENGKTLDVNTQEGRANRDVIVSNWDAVKNLAAAQFEQGASVEDVTAAMRGNLGMLRAQLEFFGLNAEQIDVYLASMNATEAAIEQVTSALQEQARVAAAEEAAERQVRTEDYLYRTQKLGAERYLDILRRRLVGLEKYSDEWIRIMDQIDRAEADHSRNTEERLRKIIDDFNRLDDAATAANKVAEGLGKVTDAVFNTGIMEGSQGRSTVLDQLNAIADAARAAVEGGASVSDVMAGVNADLVRLRQAVVAGGGSAADFDRLRRETGRASGDYARMLQAVQAVTINAPVTINGNNMTAAQVAQAVTQGITSAATAAAQALRAT